MHFPAFLRKKVCSTIVTLAVIIPVINASAEPTIPVSPLKPHAINETERCLERGLKVTLGHDDAIQETEVYAPVTHTLHGQVALLSDTHHIILPTECGFEIVAGHHADLCTCSLQYPDRAIVSLSAKCLNMIHHMVDSLNKECKPYKSWDK